MIYLLALANEVLAQSSEGGNPMVVFAGIIGLILLAFFMFRVMGRVGSADEEDIEIEDPQITSARRAHRISRALKTLEEEGVLYSEPDELMPQPRIRRKR